MQMRIGFKSILSVFGVFLLISLSVGPTFFPQTFSNVVIVLTEEETNEDDSSENENDPVFLLSITELKVSILMEGHATLVMAGQPVRCDAREIPHPPPNSRV